MRLGKPQPFGSLDNQVYRRAAGRLAALDRLENALERMFAQQSQHTHELTGSRERAVQGLEPFTQLAENRGQLPTLEQPGVVQVGGLTPQEREIVQWV